LSHQPACSANRGPTNRSADCVHSPHPVETWRASLPPLIKLVAATYLAIILFAVFVPGVTAWLFGFNIFTLFRVIKDELFIAFSDAVRADEKRGVIVYERIASSPYSGRMLKSFGPDGAVRISPLHCHGPGDVARFLCSDRGHSNGEPGKGIASHITLAASACRLEQKPVQRATATARRVSGN
jgi:hypothetical protein